MQAVKIRGSKTKNKTVVVVVVVVVIAAVVVAQRHNYSTDMTRSARSG